LHREELAGAADGGLELLNRRMIAADVLPSGTGVAFLRGFVGVYRANLEAVYAPAPLAGNTQVLLLRSAEAQPAALVAPQFATLRAAPELGWKDYIRCPLAVEEVAGDHLTMMRPSQVTQLAGVIMTYLEHH